MDDALAHCFFRGTMRLAEKSFEVESNVWGTSLCVSDPCTDAELELGDLPATCYQGHWVSQAWSVSCESYIPQKVKAQIKPLCEMSTVPAKVLWNFSAVLAYVGHLEIKWNRNNMASGNHPAAHSPESLI